MLKIKDRLKNNIAPSCMGLFDVAVEKIESKDVIKITFASGTEKPKKPTKKRRAYSWKNTYIRHIKRGKNKSRFVFVELAIGMKREESINLFKQLSESILTRKLWLIFNFVV